MDLLAGSVAVNPVTRLHAQQIQDATYQIMSLVGFPCTAATELLCWQHHVLGGDTAVDAGGDTIMLPRAVRRLQVLHALPGAALFQEFVQIVCSPEVQSYLLNQPERRDSYCVPALPDATLGSLHDAARSHVVSSEHLPEFSRPRRCCLTLTAAMSWCWRWQSIAMMS